MRTVLLDIFCRLTTHFVHENRSIGHFLLIDSSFCPWEPFYWTFFADCLLILSMSAVLLDIFCWLTTHFVHENPSIGHFLQIASSFCPWAPFYWTFFADCLFILSARATLLDNFCRLPPHFVHERRSIGHFLLIDHSFCPWALFYWTFFADWPLILSMRTLLLDIFCRLPPHFVHERRSIGHFLQIASSFCPREPLYWTIFADCLLILSVRTVLLDIFCWLTTHFVHERRSIGHFLLIDSSFCPWALFYWTFFADWPLILSMSAVLLDIFCRLTTHFVHENRSWPLKKAIFFM